MRSPEFFLKVIAKCDKLILLTVIRKKIFLLLKEKLDFKKFFYIFVTENLFFLKKEKVMTEVKKLTLKKEELSKNEEFELPPIQGAELPETLSDEVALLFHLIPYDISTIVFLEKLNTLKNPELLSEKNFEDILQRVKFYRKTMPLLFFSKMEDIITKVLKYNKKAMDEFLQIKSKRL